MRPLARNSTARAWCEVSKFPEDGWVSYILQLNEPSKAYRNNWARLIQKIYEVDPSPAPSVRGPMRVISFIEDPQT